MLLLHPAAPIQQDQGRGVVQYVQEEAYQYTLTFRKRVPGSNNDALDPSS